MSTNTVLRVDPDRDLLTASLPRPVRRSLPAMVSADRCRGQGMTEYIIIVALVAVAAIGVYSAFGDVVRGQAAVAAVALSGEDNSTGRSLVSSARGRANSESRSKTLEDYEE